MSMRKVLIGVVGMVAAVLGAGSLGPSVQAAQTVPYKINYQGRLVDATGNPRPNGLYNMRFRIHTVASGGTASWTETRETTNRVQVTNGIFSVQLGDVTALSPSLFIAYPLYFEVELPTAGTATCSTASCASWTEGAMTPRALIGASPYAMNADTIDGIDGASFVQLGANSTLTGTNVFRPASNSTSAFVIQASGGANLLVADTTNMALKVGGGDVSADGSPALLVVDHKSTANDPTGVNGGMYYNASAKRFRCYQDSEWKDCIGGGGGDAMLPIRERYAYYQEFMGAVNIATTSYTPSVRKLIDPILETYANGGTFSGSGAGAINLNYEAQRPGILQLKTGTLNTGNAFVGSALLANGVPYDPFQFGQGAWVLAGAVRLPVLSDGTQTYTARFGLFGNVASNGCMFRYGSAINSGKWQGMCATAGVESVCDVGITPTASSWHNLKVAINADGSTATFVVDDVNTCSVTSNIPTNANVSVVSGIIKSAGTTSRVMDVDFIEYEYETLSR